MPRIIWAPVIFLTAFFLFNCRYDDFQTELKKLHIFKRTSIKARVVENRGFIKEKYYVKAAFLSPEPEIYLNLKSFFAMPDMQPGTIVNLKGKTRSVLAMSPSGYRTYLINNRIAGSMHIWNKRQYAVQEKTTMPLNYHIKKYLKDKFSRYISYPSSSLSFALLTGSKDMIPASVKEIFRKTGTYHMLAVSGMHAGIIIAVFFMLLRLFNLRKKTCLLILVIVVLPFYLIITDWQISIVRTYFMVAVGLVLMLTGRKVEPMRILFFSLLLMLLLDQRTVYTVSLQLSFAAVFGIFLMLGLINQTRMKHNVLLQYIAVSMGAQFFTMPILIYYFGYINFFAIIYNTLIMFLIPLSLIFSFMLAVSPIARLSIYIGKGVMFVNRLIFKILYNTSYEFSFFHISGQDNIIYSVVLFTFFLSIVLLLKSAFKNRDKAAPSSRGISLPVK
ncbi:MAG TPA: ComEC/Rec2 family competence protein [Spirochaetota bacterium]|nr:ComEC/Rec2 family competence protein [Spirochaetota bacterium]